MIAITAYDPSLPYDAAIVGRSVIMNAFAGHSVGAAGERRSAGDDRREEEPRDEPCQEVERHRPEERLLEAAAEPPVRECEDGVVREQEEDRVDRHADAVEERLGRSLKRQDCRRDRQHKEDERRRGCRSPDEPVQRCREGCGDHHADLHAVRDRIG